MRTVQAAITAAVAASALASCASAGQGSTYSDEIRALADDCRARGGILQPLPGGPQTGNPAADNQCIIRGGPSERLRTEP